MYKYKLPEYLKNCIRLSAVRYIDLGEDKDGYVVSGTPESFDSFVYTHFCLENYYKYYIFNRVVPNTYCTKVFEYNLKKRVPNLVKYSDRTQTIFWGVTEASRWKNEISNVIVYLTEEDEKQVEQIYRILEEQHCSFDCGEYYEAFCAIAENVENSIVLHYSVVNSNAYLNIYCKDVEKHFNSFEKAFFDPDSKPVSRQSLSGIDFFVMPE